MGGDDLGSDDEYLLNSSSLPEVVDDAVSDDDDRPGTSGSKRKRARDDDNVTPLERDESNEDKPSKTTKGPATSSRVLVTAGRDLATRDAQVQSAFLWTALKHHVQLKGDSVETLAITQLLPSHLCTSSEPSLEMRLRSVLSLKKLKKHKALQSPRVVICCLSARRAVEVLKELASFKVRVAKLFAKHMNPTVQRAMLEQQSFGIAVGTPNRLLALANSEGEEPALHFRQTRLVVLDGLSNQKGFTVCTLPDTAPDTMELLRHCVLPQLSKRKDIKLAIF